MVMMPSLLRSPSDATSSYAELSYEGLSGGTYPEATYTITTPAPVITTPAPVFTTPLPTYAPPVTTIIPMVTTTFRPVAPSSPKPSYGSPKAPKITPTTKAPSAAYGPPKKAPTFTVSSPPPILVTHLPPQHYYEETRG